MLFGLFSAAHLLRSPVISKQHVYQIEGTCATVPLTDVGFCVFSWDLTTLRKIENITSLILKILVASGDCSDATIWKLIRVNG